MHKNLSKPLKIDWNYKISGNSQVANSLKMLWPKFISFFSHPIALTSLHTVSHYIFRDVWHCWKPLDQKTFLDPSWYAETLPPHKPLIEASFYNYKKTTGVSHCFQSQAHYISCSTLSCLLLTNSRQDTNGRHDTRSQK